MEVFPIVAPSPDHMWVEIYLPMLVTERVTEKGDAYSAVDLLKVIES